MYWQPLSSTGEAEMLAAAPALQVRSELPSVRGPQALASRSHVLELVPVLLTDHEALGMLAQAQGHATR